MKRLVSFLASSKWAIPFLVMVILLVRNELVHQEETDENVALKSSGRRIKEGMSTIDYYIIVIITSSRDVIK